MIQVKTIDVINFLDKIGKFKLLMLQHREKCKTEQQYEFADKTLSFINDTFEICCRFNDDVVYNRINSEFYAYITQRVRNLIKENEDLKNTVKALEELNNIDHFNYPLEKFSHE